jgi:uncharacterized protein (UPF0332 family)
MAMRDLKTAEHVLKIDASWSMTMIYQALLRAGRALLMAHGVLPADGGQHKTVVEIVGKIIGEDYSDAIYAFDKMRKKRNLFFYESVQASTETDARNAYKTSKKIINRIKEILREMNPQLRLEFD